jgi:thioredoxin-dependent peroxiredoxin
VLLGVTFSTVKDLKAWRREVGLGPDLLCDVDRSVAIAYGAADGPAQERPRRRSVLIGADASVLNVYDVADAAGHPAAVLADLG